MTESNVDWMQLIIDTTHRALDLYSAITEHWWGPLSIFHNICIRSNFTISRRKQKECFETCISQYVCYHSVKQLVAAILWGRQYHRAAAAVHPSNLSSSQDNVQYICGSKLASKSQCKIQDTFTQLKNDLSLNSLDEVKEWSGLYA